MSFILQCLPNINDCLHNNSIKFSPFISSDDIFTPGPIQNRIAAFGTTLINQVGLLAIL